jgi:uncharacterized protein YutE (UPF0331/DUF86 family)
VKLNLDLLTGRIEIIRVSLQRLKELAGLSEEEFLSDYRNPASAESFIRHCLEAIFDIGRHILAKSGNIRLTHEYKSIARGLGEIGVVSKELSDRVSQMAGYRNRIVHFYHEITDEELYEILQNDLHDIERFLVELGDFLQRYTKGEV